MIQSKTRNDRGVLRGFTLIELLVVIAIIALLISILLPSLDAARRQAKQNACLSHIKNIASSSRVYEADDPSGWGIPVHPAQYEQCETQTSSSLCASPSFVGAYEWGGKSGIGYTNEIKDDSLVNRYNSRFGTFKGFGPATRPLNKILYPGGFPDHKLTNNRPGMQQDATLELELFQCTGDDGPPRGYPDGRGPHCPDWIVHTERSSYDHFGNSYASNMFMIAAGQTEMRSNSPYLRPTTRVPTPARTLYYEENIGRWAWSAKNEIEDCTWIGQGVDPGPTKTITGWHGKDWTFNRAFVDTHSEFQRVYLEGTEDSEGFAFHYRNERLSSYPSWGGDQGSFESLRCVIVRGEGWQKDTLPSPTLPTGLQAPGGGRPSYEGCVETE